MRVGFLVHRDGQDYGPFTPEQLREGLAGGNLLPTDFCRREDQAEWATVATCATPAATPTPDPKPTTASRVNTVSNTPLYIGAAVIVIGLLAGWLLVRGDGKTPVFTPGKTAIQTDKNATKKNGAKTGAKVDPTPKPMEERQPRPLPANAKHIPADALAVFSMRAGDLLNKAGYEQPIDIPILADHREAITQMSPFVAELLRDPESIGLDLVEPIHFYVQHVPPEGNASAGFTPLLGVVAAVSDSNALELSLSRLVETRLGGFGRQAMNSMKVENGWRILNTNRLPLAFAFSDKAMVLVMRETPRPVESLAVPLNAAVKSDSGLPATQPDFKRHLGEWMDAGIWWDTKRTREVLAKEDDADMRALVAGLTDARALSTGVYFEKGAASWFVHQQSAEGATAMTGDGLKDPLPSLISGRAVLAIGLSLDMPAVRHWLAGLPAKFGAQLDLTPSQIDDLLNASTGLNYAQWLALPAGGVAVTVIDVQPGTTSPQPQLLAGFTVANTALADQLLKHMTDSGAKQDLARANLALLKSNNGMLCLSTLDQQVAAQLGRVNDPVMGDQLALLRGHGVAGWVDASRTRAAAKTLNAPQSLLATLKPFDKAHFSGADKAGHMRLDLHLTLRDPAANSLRATLELAGQLTGMLGSKQSKPAAARGPVPIPVDAPGRIGGPE